MIWAGGRVAGAGDGVDDEVDNGESENGDNEANDSVKNSVLSVGDFFAITTRCDIAKTTINQHDNRDNADGIKDGVGNLGEYAIFANKLSWHTLATGSFSTFLNGKGHNFSSGKG